MNYLEKYAGEYVVRMDDNATVPHECYHLKPNGICVYKYLQPDNSSEIGFWSASEGLITISLKCGEENFSFTDGKFRSSLRYLRKRFIKPTDMTHSTERLIQVLSDVFLNKIPTDEKVNPEDIQRAMESNCFSDTHFSPEDVDWDNLPVFLKEEVCNQIDDPYKKMIIAGMIDSIIFN